METTLNISEYLSEQEIKDICTDEVRNLIKRHFKDEENSKRILSNLSYEIVFNEIDKVIPNSRELVISKTEEVLNDVKSFSVFRDGSYGKKSIAYELMETAVRNNTHLINDKVKETITNKDYSKEIWDKYESMAESFISNFYEITRLGRQKESK